MHKQDVMKQAVTTPESISHNETSTAIKTVIVPMVSSYEGYDKD